MGRVDRDGIGSGGIRTVGGRDQYLRGVVADVLQGFFPGCGRAAEYAGNSAPGRTAGRLRFRTVTFAAGQKDTA